MKSFSEKIKEKRPGFWIIFAASVLALALTIAYLAFSVRAGVFNGGIFTCLLLAVIPGIALFFYDGFFSDFFGIAIVVLLTLAFGLLLKDSVGDFTDFIVRIQLFGNMNNATPRLVLAIFIFVGIIAAIVGCFLGRRKEQK